MSSPTSLLRFRVEGWPGAGVRYSGEENCCLISGICVDFVTPGTGTGNIGFPVRRRVYRRFSLWPVPGRCGFATLPCICKNKPKHPHTEAGGRQQVELAAWCKQQSHTARSKSLILAGMTNHASWQNFLQLLLFPPARLASPNPPRRGPETR